MIYDTHELERRKQMRRSSDTNLKFSITGMFLLTALLFFSIGYYEAMREVSKLVNDNAADTRGASASHRSPDVEK
jgi:hypothetical protein